MTINVKRHTLFARFRNTILATSLLTLAACGNGSHTNQNGETVLPDETTQEQVVETPLADESQKVADDIAVETTATSDRAAILAKYAYLDPKHLVPTKALEDAVVYFEQNKSKFSNRNYISVINYGQSSKEARFYMVDMNSGGVWAIHTAHGKGSDANHDGYAEKFSNTSGSNASSLGYMRTGETYIGSHGLSLKLDGLSSTNSNVRARSIVIHPAAYVSEASVIQGRSWGCPAVLPAYRDKVIAALKNGSLIYAVVDKGTRDRDWSSGTVTTPTPTPTPNPPAEPTTREVVPLWEAKVSGSSAWTAHVESELDRIGQNLLNVVPADQSLFCPKYSKLTTAQRKQYWSFLISSMVRFESNFNTNTTYTENFNDSNGNRVVSRGLLQISIESGNAYGCAFKTTKDLHDPKQNLSCGIRILDRWIGRDKRIAGNVSGWKGGARYWSVLRSTNSTPYNSIVNGSKNLAMCK
ncbi:murein L,D-transpeptidase catalytic domain-containing protein [Bdellovibrio svalbardensis]|uniref:Murein L,D-transpeptidase catalytic domain family protein n=1 Tax=Bdellovibrio svalbardensis TaxID=2972972 RepID=A0ABT6DMM4_9BACT|nr:murein L,D-transpeptidase catalytic domain family protein [Bdellovibrio svalbardensis]MDG0818122.1 murein L,D-transpeptidase catalytic domain family protein [Bdellovibrio svalbardensis]